jgi:hypothetical protein
VRWREDGRNRTRRGFTGHQAAVEFDALKRRAARLGAHDVAEPAAIRLEAWLVDWWDRYAVGWRRSTQHERSAVLKKWVVPYLGRVRLRDLGEARIRTWREAYRDETGRSPSGSGLVAPAGGGEHLAWPFRRDRIWKPARQAVVPLREWRPQPRSATAAGFRDRGRSWRQARHRRRL